VLSVVIAGVRGRLLRIEASAVILAVGPIDLRMAVPVRLLQSLQVGEELSLRTHLYLREDQVSLFGFPSDQQLEMFELLLGVSGVGPRMALGLLSALDAGEIGEAILRGDTRTLTRAPGVGARAAARIVAELQGRVPAHPVSVQVGAAPVHEAALAALVGMGYPSAEAREAVDVAMTHEATNENVEAILRAALGILAGH
jgi:Holliday junction DNA helicase RuvA